MPGAAPSRGPIARGALSQLRALTRDQRHTLLACLLGWALDAFDFFILVFAVKAIARDFQVEVASVTVAITCTLALRPVGALLFGWAADRFGRRPTLMVNIVAYSLLELASAGAPSLATLIVLRGLYGIAMGGEWGVGAALALESAPVEARGLISGILQQGYALGYLLAALLFGLFFALVGWRGMFVVGALPALLVLYIRANVPESPAWQRDGVPRGELLRALRRNFPRFAYMVVLMAAFNLFSHGTQDLYPTFLQVQRGLTPRDAGAVAVTYNVGAIIGGMTFGALSERIGRRPAILLAAILALPMIPVWVLGSSTLALAGAAFGLQLMVQGAWGVVPAHLNELSPGSVRGTFPGLAYQLGNLMAAGTATLQAHVAATHGGNYALALGGMTAAVAIVLALTAWLGPEARGGRFHPATSPAST
jgi:SHS family lactate transporter-like MFS transporter